MPVFRYSGPDRTYSYLQVGRDQVAPVTVTDGDLVQLVDAPDDGSWEKAPKATATRLPDNHPDVIAAANDAAAAVDTPVEEQPASGFDSTHDQTAAAVDAASTATTTGQE